MGAMVRPAEPAPIRACTVSRDVQAFEYLIDDMEAALGEAWGDLSFSDVLVFLDQPEAETLEFLVLAVSDDDFGALATVEEVVAQADEKGLGIILVAADLDSATLHRLMRQGAREFLPYPVPEGALDDAIARVTAPPTPVSAPTAVLRPDDSGESGKLLAVQGLAGGVGASTLAVNLAWEIATQKKAEPRVGLFDFDLQLGQAATYLDLPRRETVYEFLADTSVADSETLGQAMLDFQGKLSVFTAPADMLPLDLITQEDVENILGVARQSFDFVIIDMPSTVVAWTETVLVQADVYMPLVELDMRSAQNALRFLKTLKAEDLPTDKLRFVLNRAPRFTDLTGRSRIKRMAESLDIVLGDLMSDGGRPVMEASDQGQPLAMAAPKNPLRKDIAALAKSLFDASTAAPAAKSRRG